MFFIKAVILSTIFIFLLFISLSFAQDWWNPSWNYREIINISNINNNQTLVKNYIVNFTFNHSYLVSQGKSLANGDDIRIVFNGVEIDRINITSFNTAATTLVFKFQENISANSYNDNSYYLYYGNPLAASPPKNKSKIFEWNPILNPSFENNSGQINTAAYNWTMEDQGIVLSWGTNCNNPGSAYDGGWMWCGAGTIPLAQQNRIKLWGVTNLSFFWKCHYFQTPSTFKFYINDELLWLVGLSGSYGNCDYNYWQEVIVNLTGKNYTDGKELATIKWNATFGDNKKLVDYIRVSYDNGKTWKFFDSYPGYLYPQPEPIVTLGSGPPLANYVITISSPQSIEANKNFSFIVTVRNATNNPITNLASEDFTVEKESEQIGFDFTNFGNGSYSLAANSGNLLGNISFRVCAKSACEEKSMKIWIGTKENIAFVADDWLAVLNFGLTGKPLFRNYSDTAKYFLEKYQPEQVFLFDNITTDFPTYRFKDLAAMLETFFDGTILVKTKEQALAAAPLAKLKNYGVSFEKYTGTFLDLTNKNTEQINDLVINEAATQRKNINTIIIANQNSETSWLTGLAVAKHNSIIIPINFSQPNYPDFAENFYQLNQQNGVLSAVEKINKTVKKLNDNWMFANNWDYKLGKQVNLILVGNSSEIPHAVVFDSGNEWFFDTDSNYVLTDFLYSDMNRDGKADLMTGRIISEYQLLSSEKQKKIVTAALYRNIEFAYSGNGLIESMSTDTAFRGAGFSAVRLIENHTSLSYYNMSAFNLLNSTIDFLKQVWKTEGIVDSLGLLFRAYDAYQEFLEHNLYKLMNSIQFSWSEGLILHFFPDERLIKQRLTEEMQVAEGIFYYGVGNESAWFLPDEKNNYKIALGFNEFPILNLPFIYNEYDKAMRGNIEKIFEKGASAIAGPTGIVHGTHAFAFNSKFTQDIARNKTLPYAIENAKFLTEQEVRNLTEIISFDYNSLQSQLSIKQFLQTVLYGEPEYKIDPNYTEQASSTEVSYNGSFVARIRIPVNYAVLEQNGTKLILFDAEQQLQEFYKPIIPVYTKEFLLPNGSHILRLSASYNTTNYTNVFIPILLPDEYYQQENITLKGFYPEKNFENVSFEMLDGRKSLLLATMPLRYNNQTKEAIVFRDIEFIVLYTSPLEILEFSAKNITSGESQTFKIKLKNIGDKKNITIVIETAGETIFNNNTIEANAEKTIEITWKPRHAAAYSASAHVLFNNNSVGPRYAQFTVSEKAKEGTAKMVLPFKTTEYFSAGGYTRILENAFEKIIIITTEEKIIIEYTSPNTKFISAADATRLERKLYKLGYQLQTIQEAGKLSELFSTQQGSLFLQKDSGAIKERCKGNCDGLRGKLNEAEAEMQNIINQINEKIR